MEDNIHSAGGIVVDAIKAQTDKIAGKMLFSMDFWSEPQEEVQLTDNTPAGTNVALPSVSVADLPSGATIVRAIAIFKSRAIENVYSGGINKLQGAQHIQVRDDTPGTWRDAITFADDMFTLAASTREGGDIYYGNLDIAIEVDANDTYEFQWTASLVDYNGIYLNDVQTGLRIWYNI